MLKLLIPVVVAALTASADAQAIYYQGNASEEAGNCSLFLKASAPGALVSDEDANAGEWCARAVLHWLEDTKRFDISVGAYTPAEIVRARCGAQVILNHATETTPVADILSAEFDKACGEPGLM